VTLLKSDETDLLQKLFGSVIIPEAVAQELEAFHGRLPGFVHIKPVMEPTLRPPGTEKLGKKESEAILLARDLRADLPDLLLTDDRKARAAATALGLRCAGLLSLLIQAKHGNHMLRWKKRLMSLNGAAVFTCPVMLKLRL
jgi:predicted nucleic acid-binding protein